MKSELNLCTYMNDGTRSVSVILREGLSHLFELFFAAPHGDKLTERRGKKSEWRKPDPARLIITTGGGTPK